MPTRQPTGRVVLARIELEDSLWAPDSPQTREALRGSLVVGTSIERYNRVWRQGPWQEDRSENVVYGKVGFERSEGTTELWDARRGDFLPQPVRLGQTSPFAVDLTTLRVAFQLRPGRINRGSFTGAMQALLNEAAPPEYRWIVRNLLVELEWDEWRAGVDKVVEIRVKVEPPNPHYSDKDIESFVKDARAEAIMISARNRQQGVQLSPDSLLKAAFDHARHYGSVRATGELADGRTTTWDSEVSVPPPVTTAASPETREITREGLLRRLRERVSMPQVRRRSGSPQARDRS